MKPSACEATHWGSRLLLLLLERLKKESQGWIKFVLWRTCTYTYTVTLLAALVAVLEHHHKHLHAFLEIWMVQCLSIKSAHSTSQVWAALTGFQQTDKYISTHTHRVIYTAEVHLGVCIGYTHAYKLCRQPWVHSMENIALRISDKVWISDY